MLALVNEKFKTGIINMFKVLKENMPLISKQIVHLSLEIEAIKEKQMENPEIKTTKSKMNSVIG